MPEKKNYYEVLGVAPEASPEEIRSAYRAKAMAFHPDRLVGVSNELRRLAEERLKEINGVNEVLSDPEKRRKYHPEWLKRYSPPIPSVDPAGLLFDDVAAGHPQAASFLIRNQGGPYANIRVDDPGSWVMVTGYESLNSDGELPLRVDVRVLGDRWGTVYSDSITVSLDDEEAKVTIRLRTKAAPTVTMTAASRSAVRRPAVSSRGKKPSQALYSGEAGALLTHAVDGASIGMRWGAIAGVTAAMATGVAVVASSGFGVVVSVFLAPAFAVLFGVVGAVMGTVLGGVLGAAVGVVIWRIRGLPPEP